jgi:alanine-glyoxylate transaminase/serine-glyoxylate transaminase/serine-pyruvate transaminase
MTASYLKKILDTHGDAYLIPGSGTIAIEAAIGSLVGVGEKAIIGSNGFGERLVQFTQALGKTIEVKAEWGEALSRINSPKRCDNTQTRLVAVVHFETSTGILNPVRDIARYARLLSAYLYGWGFIHRWVPFSMDDWGVDVTVTAPQKCLGAPPGLGLIGVAPSVWPRIEQRAKQPHGWYSNLNTWRWYQVNWADWHPSPMTMPVNIVLALREALIQLLDEGLDRRIDRFSSLATHLRSGLRDLQMPIAVPESMSSSVMTVAWGAWHADQPIVRFWNRVWHSYRRRTRDFQGQGD